MSHTRNTANKRAKRRRGASPTILPGTRVIVDEGERHCVEHGKLWFATEAEARTQAALLARDGSHEPGLEPYPCASSRGWHVGHSNRARGRIG